MSVDVLNLPEVDLREGTHIPALTSVEQAIALVQRLQQEYEEERGRKNARIAEAYNAVRPYDPDRLRADGLAWKSNFSTKPLAQVVDRVVPRYVSLIRGLRYLTAAELPPHIPQAAAKTDKFRQLVTRTVRAHPQWEDFLYSVAQEMVLYGYAIVAWPWRTEWFPLFFTQPDALVLPGTPHNAALAPVLCLRQQFLRHELLMHIKDREAAEQLGWDVDAVVDSINRAEPKSAVESASSATLQASRQWADLVRESSVASSYLGAPVVDAWHVFIAEVDQRVTHVIFDARTRRALLWREKYFDDMGQVAVFFSFQHGNGRLHGSKGLGRELYNLTRVLDRVRCEIVDRFNLSGKLLFQCDPKDLNKFRMTVYGNAILVGTPFQAVETRLDSGVQAYLPLDQFLSSLTEQLAGAVSPRQFSKERTTRAEVEWYASREEERREAMLERFLVQFARMMTVIQRRLLSPFVRDPRALELQEQLRSFLSEEEYQILAEAPASSTVRDYSDAQRAAVVELSREVRGNPLYNQVELERQRLIAQFGPEFADTVLLPQPDPTDSAEQSRLQVLELQALRDGTPVPVSPRDNHGVHLAVLQDAARGMVEQAIQSETAGPGAEVALAGAVSMLRHAAEHLAAAEAAGLSGEVQPFRQFFQSFEAALRKLLETEPEPGANGAGASTVVGEGAEAPPAPGEAVSVPVE